ncbi:MAG: HAD family phosphatase [Bacteroidales bacterium]|nr:MAG: HAD family phosphatase [Bacteroidales bacterium]
MKRIRNIIFDLGSVLLDIDVDRTLSSFDEIGIPGRDLVAIYKEKDNFFLLLERGEINANTFRDNLRNLSRNHLSNDQIDTAWNAMVIGFEAVKIELLKGLKNKYDLYLLSNTNEIHEPVYARQFIETSGGASLHEIFTKVYYSYVVKRSKPDPEIYRHVLNDARLIAEESLFIDDLQSNIEAAAEFGLVCHRFTEYENLKDVLKRYRISC